MLHSPFLLQDHFTLIIFQIHRLDFVFLRCWRFCIIVRCLCKQKLFKLSQQQRLINRVRIIAVTFWVELDIFFINLWVSFLQQGQSSIKLSLHFRVQLLQEKITLRHQNTHILRERRQEILLTTSLSSELDSDDSESLSSARSPNRSFTTRINRKETRFQNNTTLNTILN